MSVTVHLRPADTVFSQFTGVTAPEEDHHTLIDEAVVNETDYIRATVKDKEAEFVLDNLPAGVDRILTLHPTLYINGDAPSDDLLIRFEVRLNGAVVCSGEFTGDTSGTWGFFPDFGGETYDVNILATDWNAGVKTLYLKELVP